MSDEELEERRQKHLRWLRATEFTANQVIRLRAAAGLTQEELARRIGVTPVTIRGWEGGHRQISPPNAAKLEDVLHGVGVFRQDTWDPEAADAPIPEFTPAEIKDLRRRTGMTQAQFAEYLGVHASTVTDWERGVPGNGPSKKSRARLELAFHELGVRESAWYPEDGDQA